MSDINFSTAKFLKSAPGINECPPEQGAEVAFAGRSNAGKSSAINKLTRCKDLARTSKTPGRTQLINFFQLNNSPELRLVDLPGYGYAKVSIEKKLEWQRNLSQYLHERESLKGVILLMDIRHPMQELDAMMVNWAVESEMPVHAVLTKADKLNRGAAKSALLKYQRDMQTAGLSELVTAQTFSAVTGDGVAELARLIGGWLRSGK